MKIGHLEKVPYTEKIARTVTYEVLVIINTSWKTLVLLFELNGHLVSWQFKNEEDQRKFQELEVKEQQSIHYQLSDQELLKKGK